MKDFIAFILGNFTLTFLVLGGVFSIFSLISKKEPYTKENVIEAFFSYYLLIGLGVSYFYNFVMHVFLGDMAAHFIGWENSPFQAEVGFASLGFSVVNIMAFWQNFGFRAASVIAPAFFLWGAAGGHIYQIITTGNLASGNAGIMLWTDILMPVISFAFLWLQYKYPKTY